MVRALETHSLRAAAILLPRQEDEVCEVVSSSGWEEVGQEGDRETVRSTGNSEHLPRAALPAGFPGEEGKKLR